MPIGCHGLRRSAAFAIAAWPRYGAAMRFGFAMNVLLIPTASGGPVRDVVR
jgi:hypothetical protein